MSTTQKPKKSIVKRILKWFGIFILLLLAAIIVLPIIFKDDIIAMVKEETNKNLNAKVDFGDIDLTLFSSFPSFSLSIQNISVKGVDDFEGVTLADIGAIKLKLDLMSVISGDKMEINSIGIEAPKIHVKVLPDGRANYDIAKADTTAVVEEETAESSGSFSLNLEEYYLTDGEITYDDQQGKMKLYLNELNHRGSAQIGETYLLTTTTSLKDLFFNMEGVDYVKRSVVKVDCNLDVAMTDTEMKISFKENNVALNEFGLAFDGWLNMIGDKMDMDVTFASTKNSFSSLLSMVPGVYSPDFGAMKTDGYLKFDGAVKGEYSDASMPGFVFNLNVGNAFFQYPDLPAKVDKINIDTHIEREAGNDLNNTKVDVNNFHLEFAGNVVDASMKLRNLMLDPFIDGKIETYLDLVKIGQIMPLAEGEEYQGIITTNIVLKGNVSALEQEKYDEFEAKGDLGVKQIVYKSPDLNFETKIDSMLFRFSPQNLALVNFDAMIGKSDLHANGTIDNYMEYFLKDEVLKGEFNVKSMYLDLDEMMYAPESVAPATPAEVPAELAQTVDSSSYIFPIPKNVNFLLHTNLNKVIYDSLPLDNINGNITINEGTALLDKLKMGVFGGSIEMSGSYFAETDASAHINFDMNILKLDIPKAAQYLSSVETMVPVAKYCTGSFSTALTLETDLDRNAEPVYPTLNGKGKVQTHKVVVEDFPAMVKIATLVNQPSFKKAVIEDMNISYAFKEGKIWIEPYNLKLGKASAVVSGTTSFTSELDYVMDMKVPREMLGAAGNDLLNGALGALNDKGVKVNVDKEIPIKILIKGTATDPKVTTDFAAQKENIKENIKDQVKDKVYEQAQKLLEQAQLQADKLVAEAKKQADEIRAQGKAAADKIRDEGKKAGAKVEKEGTDAAEKVRAEGYKQAQKLIDEAKNPVALKIAEKAAEKGRKETDEKVEKMIVEAKKKGKETETVGENNAKKTESESEEKAKAVEDAAQKKADEIMADAQAKADKIKE